MQTIFETLKIVLPTIIAGLFTFFVTKYTYSKNRPLDKLEIAYNRIYYPIYRIVFSQDTDESDMGKIIDRCMPYFCKYTKYADVSTIRLFNLLCECEKEAKRKSIYQQFKDNIDNRNSYLRRRLGYLQPSFAQMYKYAMPYQKSLFRIMIGLFLIYVSLVVCSITTIVSTAIFKIFAVIFVFFMSWVICEFIWCFLRSLYYKIRK